MYKALKETTRHYYKYVTTEDDWEQPTITTNGTLGGDEFAVTASSSASDQAAYHAFDSTGWASNSTSASTFTFYSPTPIKVTGLAFAGNAAHLFSYFIKTYNLYASNDNSNWTDLGSYTQNTDYNTVVYNDINNDNYYKYYRINSTSRSNRDGISNLVISALEQVTDIEESTSSDYDFYKDVDTYKGFINTTLKTSQTFYPSNEIKSWTVPSGISSIHVKCAGAKGSNSKDNATLGGNGGIVECDLTVSSGQTLYFVVGQSNTIGYTASYNASDIRTNNAGITDSTSLASRIIVAGAGGNSGWTGTKSARGVGGLGGGLTAGDGESKGYNTGGAGATQSTGYSIGMGGNGSSSRGGAGGAGYYGGFGGRGHGHNGTIWEGGGGGGSSYTNADCSNVVHSQGANEGNAYITISSSQPIFPVNTYSLIYDDTEIQQDFESSITGQYAFKVVESGSYHILMVGNGAPGGSSQRDGKWFYNSGGSGASFEGDVNLTAGSYRIVIGELGYAYNINNRLNLSGGTSSSDTWIEDSEHNILITAGCGLRGTNTSGAGGAGGTLTLNITPTATQIQNNGNTGVAGDSSHPNTPSSYDNTLTGYGAGTGSYLGAGNVYGIAGIVSIHKN